MTGHCRWCGFSRALVIPGASSFYAGIARIEGSGAVEEGAAGDGGGGEPGQVEPGAVVGGVEAGGLLEELAGAVFLTSFDGCLGLGEEGAVSAHV